MKANNETLTLCHSLIQTVYNTVESDVVGTHKVLEMMTKCVNRLSEIHQGNIEDFVKEYMKDFSTTASANRCGFKESDKCGYYLLELKEVSDKIEGQCQAMLNRENYFQLNQINQLIEKRRGMRE
tara:strand:+ start:604 stop:978 length:375 start_codon:yes stop_codon:yes gene_type:complete